MGFFKPKRVIPIFLILLGLGGCVNPFAPRLTDSLDASGLIITDQQSPAEVLQNFRIAYMLRDSLLYSNLLDTTFQFIYDDPTATVAGIPFTMSRDEDLGATGGLFRHFHFIDLIWNATIYESVNDGAGRLSRSFNLTMISENSDYLLSGKATFSFRKCNDERWRITRWRDDSDI